MTPDKTLKFKGEKCVWRKFSKERITAFVAVNVSGTEKRKIMVISHQKTNYVLKILNGCPSLINQISQRKCHQYFFKKK